jgi:hypothetical protein
MHYNRSTVEHGGKHLIHIVASLGRNLPAVEIELLLKLLQCPLGSHLPLIGQVGLIAHNEDSDLAQVNCLICMVAGVLARRSQF